MLGPLERAINALPDFPGCFITHRVTDENDRNGAWKVDSRRPMPPLPALKEGGRWRHQAQTPGGFPASCWWWNAGATRGVRTVFGEAHIAPGELQVAWKYSLLPLPARGTLLDAKYAPDHNASSPPECSSVYRGRRLTGRHPERCVQFHYLASIWDCDITWSGPSGCWPIEVSLDRRPRIQVFLQTSGRSGLFFSL